MKLRTQLVLAFLLLAVLPLTGVTVYSYIASQRAFRKAVEAEAGALAEQMSSQTEEVVRELGDRIRRMRERTGPGDAPSAYETARRDALASAEQAEMGQVLRSIVSATERQQGSIPFAIDTANRIYTTDPADLPKVQGLGLVPAAPGTASTANRQDWVVVMRRDAASGISVGVARPVGAALQEIRRTAARNLAFGVGMIALALLGILPLSRRMTRHLASLTEGVERLAEGDLDVRVPVPHGAELGRLAETFNRMARDLRANQDRRIQQERLHKELEISRRIQEELLPRETLRFPFAEVGGVSIPAREVGGDFFNYFALRDGEAAVLVGDVSGKGVPAALLMANIQATLRARLPLERDLARLADHLDHDLASTAPGAPYLTLFMAVLDGQDGRLRYVNAGHNTQFAVSASGVIERLESTGRPLGLLPGGGFTEHGITLGDGDGLFLFTDGLVESENAAGEPFGMERIESILIEHRGSGRPGLLAAVDEAVRVHRGAVDAADDATMLALRFLLPNDAPSA
jgi:serine phosphatase RsbU (regulator of sigma subunit)